MWASRQIAQVILLRARPSFTSSLSLTHPLATPPSSCYPPYAQAYPGGQLAGDDDLGGGRSQEKDGEKEGEKEGEERKLDDHGAHAATEGGHGLLHDGGEGAAGDGAEAAQSPHVQAVIAISLAVLQAAFSAEATAIVVDDAQFADPLSFALIMEAGRRVRPSFVAIGFRPARHGHFHARAEELHAAPGACLITVGPLSAAEVAALARRALGAGALPPAALSSSSSIASAAAAGGGGGVGPMAGLHPILAEQLAQANGHPLFVRCAREPQP